MTGKRAQSPAGGVPQTRRTQAADAPGDPAVSGARGLPGVSRVALGESRMTQPSSGRSRLTVGARAPQSSQSHTQTSNRSRGSERRVPGWGRRRERPRGSLVPQAPGASPTSCLRPRNRAFHPAGGGPSGETVNPRASEDSLIPEIQGVRQSGWTQSRSAAPPRPAGTSEPEQAHLLQGDFPGSCNLPVALQSRFCRQESRRGHDVTLAC